MIQHKEINELLDELQDIEQEMHNLQRNHCNCECVYFDNGCGCKDDCQVLEILGELYAKAQKKLKAL